MSCVYQAETGIFSHSPCEQYGTIPEHDMSGPLIIGIFGQLVATPAILPVLYPAPLHYQRSLIAQINTNYLSTM